jgi:HAD superfamily hydrolase (TIGR01490 family)
VSWEPRAGSVPGSGAGRLPRPALAFFDVDETLLATKSMLDFWHFWRTARHEWPAVGGQDDHDGEVRTTGADRSTLNRAYYRRFAGVPAHAVRAAAHRWYDAHRRRPDGFVVGGLQALRWHRCRGHEVVLVSGSLRPVVERVAEDLGATEVCCTEQVVSADGVLTGEVDRPMIGRAKADAVAAVLAERGVPAAQCFAYGDHDSDLDMLRSVGNPVVVGGTPALRQEAERCGWPVLSPRTGPLEGLADRRIPAGVNG